jgi:hypothetical protein
MNNMLAAYYNLSAVPAARPRIRVLSWLWLALILVMLVVLADGHIKGGCVIGESAAAHGRTDQEAVTDIRRYAQLYAGNFQKFRKTERGIRASINALLELEQWTQADIISFTRQQRELLYLSIGSQIATGRMTTDELPGYASAIRQKITDIEIEFGCEVLPDTSKPNG